MKTYHASFGKGKIEIDGYFIMSGPQSVGENGLPQEIFDLFEKNPDIKTITITHHVDGITVYQRMKEE